MTAEAYGGDGQVSARSDDGWSYAVPLDAVFWTDASGSVHESGRPECLPAAGTTKRLRFAAVSWTTEQVGARSVVWIDCRR